MNLSLCSRLVSSPFRGILGLGLTVSLLVLGGSWAQAQPVSAGGPVLPSPPPSGPAGSVARGPRTAPSANVPGVAGVTSPKGEAGATVAPCGRGLGNALSEVACEIAFALQSAADSTSAAAAPLVISAPLTSEVEVKSARELVARLASVVAGRLGKGARLDSEPRSLPAARSVAKGRGGALLYLRPDLTGGTLRVVADLYPGPGRFWERLRSSEPPAAVHTFVSRRVDPELRSFLPPVPLVLGRVDKVPAPEKQGVALGCEDLDGDGAPELVFVGRQHIQWGRLRHGQFRSEKQVAWRELSTVAQAPLAEPLAGVAIEPGAHLDVGLSDRAYAVRLDSRLSLLQKTGRRLPWPGGGCSAILGVGLGSALEPCFPGDPKPRGASASAVPRKDWGGTNDALGAARLLDRSGKPFWVQALRQASTGDVLLRDDRGHEAQIHNLGAQIAVGDWDGDGEAEIVAGANVLEPEHDEITVSTWRASGALEIRQRMPVPKGVRALALCPAEDFGHAPLALIAGDELWVIH